MIEILIGILIIGLTIGLLYVLGLYDAGIIDEEEKNGFGERMLIGVVNLLMVILVLGVLSAISYGLYSLGNFVLTKI